jgi:hypothetical protein
MTSNSRKLAAEAFKRGLFRLGLSFRFARPRGAFCHAGWCQQCKVALSNGRVDLACCLPSSELSSYKKPNIWRKPISILGRLLRPWFYENILLRPTRFQEFFLRQLRRSSSALPLASSKKLLGKNLIMNCNTLVVGGGEAGLAAAETLRESGIDVLLVDEQLNSEKKNIESWHLSGTIALGLYRKSQSQTSALCASTNGSININFERLVVATGAYDRLPIFPGNDLPGIIGSNAFERLCLTDALPVSKTFALYAPKNVALQLANRANDAGIKFAWATGSSELPENIADRVYNSAYPIRALGRGSLQRVQLSDNRTLDCDVLVIGFRQPTYELQIQAGQTPKYQGPGSAILVDGNPDLPLLTVGEAAGVVADVKEHTHALVKQWLAGEASLTEPSSSPAPFPGPFPLSKKVIACPCEDVRVDDIRVALSDGYNSIEHLKRRTGAATGPCQGKLCHAILLQCLAEAGVPATLPTMRPLVRPVSLSNFAGGQHE